MADPLARIPCCVPGCSRTRRPGVYREWLCQNHWPLVPASLKRLRRSIRYRLHRRGELLKQADGWLPTTERAARVEGWLWARAKRAAIERSYGI